jgi:hypothetical protein
MYIEIESMVFNYKNTYNYTYSPKIVCLKMNHFPPDLHLLGSPKSHHHDSKPTIIQNSNL